MRIVAKVRDIEFIEAKYSFTLKPADTSAKVGLTGKPKGYLIKELRDKYNADVDFSPNSYRISYSVYEEGQAKQEPKSVILEKFGEFFNENKVSYTQLHVVYQFVVHLDSMFDSGFSDLGKIRSILRTTQNISLYTGESDKDEVLMTVSGSESSTLDSAKAELYKCLRDKESIRSGIRSKLEFGENVVNEYDPLVKKQYSNSRIGKYTSGDVFSYAAMAYPRYINTAIKSLIDTVSADRGESSYEAFAKKLISTFGLSFWAKFRADRLKRRVALEKNRYLEKLLIEKNPDWSNKDIKDFINGKLQRTISSKELTVEQKEDALRNYFTEEGLAYVIGLIRPAKVLLRDKIISDTGLDPTNTEDQGKIDKLVEEAANSLFRDIANSSYKEDAQSDSKIFSKYFLEKDIPIAKLNVIDLYADSDSLLKERSWQQLPEKDKDSLYVNALHADLREDASKRDAAVARVKNILEDKAKDENTKKEELSKIVKENYIDVLLADNSLEYSDDELDYLDILLSEKNPVSRTGALRLPNNARYFLAEKHPEIADEIEKTPPFSSYDLADFNSLLEHYDVDDEYVAGQFGDLFSGADPERYISGELAPFFTTPLEDIKDSKILKDTQQEYLEQLHELSAYLTKTLGKNIFTASEDDIKKFDKDVLYSVREYLKDNFYGLTLESALHNYNDWLNYVQNFKVKYPGKNNKPTRQNVISPADDGFLKEVVDAYKAVEKKIPTTNTNEFKNSLIDALVDTDEADKQSAMIQKFDDARSEVFGDINDLLAEYNKNNVSEFNSTVVDKNAISKMRNYTNYLTFLDNLASLYGQDTTYGSDILTGTKSTISKEYGRLLNLRNKIDYLRNTEDRIPKQNIESWLSTINKRLSNLTQMFEDAENISGTELEVRQKEKLNDIIEGYYEIEKELKKDLAWYQLKEKQKDNKNKNNNNGTQQEEQILDEDKDISKQIKEEQEEQAAKDSVAFDELHRKTEE